MKFLRHTLPTLLCALLPWVVAAQLPSAQQADPDNPLVQLQKFNQFYRFLNSAYVDTVDNAKLVENAIREVLQQLDPHSSYLTAEEMVGVKETFTGSFSGIGIEYNILRDTIFVVNVIAGGPSESVGLLPNDRIVGVDGRNVVGSKQVEVPKMLRGPKGTRVELEVVRAGEKEPLAFSIIRDNISITTVDAAYKPTPATGYIRLNRFANNSYREVAEALAGFGPVEAVILDLRSNGGGLLDQAVHISNFFLPRGAVVVTTEGTHVSPERFACARNGEFPAGKVIILTNEFSASASEIVAGAVQDWDRGLVVGRRTFGKGLVQSQFPLNDGSAVRVTVARYHTPSGRAIQRPYEQGKGDEYRLDLVKRIDKDSTASGVDSTQVYHTLRTGRTVYGGGGITPDVTVETDTLPYTKYWSGLLRQGILIEYVMTYMDQHRKQLERLYPTPAEFLADFEPDEAALQGLQAAAERKNIRPEGDDLARSGGLIARQLKALIAQKLWGMNEYFLVWNQADETYRKALEILDNWPEYSRGLAPAAPK